MTIENKKLENPTIQQGWTLRDEFANSAMQAHLSTDYGILHNSDSTNDAMLCARFYDFADAMLKQREL